MPYKDAQAQKDSQSRWYAANRVDQIKKAGERKRANQEALKTIIVEAKSVPCADCGIQYPYPVMDFHHLGEKDGPIAVMINRNVSKKRLLAEIAKCVVLCANCHRIRTYCGVR